MDSVTCITPQVCFLYFYLCDWSQTFCVFLFFIILWACSYAKKRLLLCSSRRKESGLFLISSCLNLLSVFKDVHAVIFNVTPHWCSQLASTYNVQLSALSITSRLLDVKRVSSSTCKKVPYITSDGHNVSEVQKDDLKRRSDISASCRTLRRAECLHCKLFFSWLFVHIHRKASQALIVSASKHYSRDENGLNLYTKQFFGLPRGCELSCFNLFVLAQFCPQSPEPVSAINESSSVFQLIRFSRFLGQ